jgi:hypothetical protein
VKAARVVWLARVQAPNSVPAVAEMRDSVPAEVAAWDLEPVATAALAVGAVAAELTQVPAARVARALVAGVAAMQDRVSAATAGLVVVAAWVGAGVAAAELGLAPSVAASSSAAA